MARKTIQAVARTEFWKMAEQAKAEGKDLGEVLDRCGMLLTPARKALIEANTYRELAEMLDTSSAHEWTDKDNPLRSPEDAKRAISRRIKMFVEAYERKANGVS
jgi:hypothetical protein